MSNDCLSLFSLCRQASLNEAAEKYYGQAASLRPNVSSLQLRRPANHSLLLFTLMDAVQSQSGWLSSVIAARSAPSQRPSLSAELRKNEG